MEPDRGNSKSSPDQQALFNAIHHSCNVNANGDISLESLLQFIKEEIEVQVVDWQSWSARLTLLLQRDSRCGWITFEDVWQIFCSWMDQLPSVSQFKFIKPCRTYNLISPLASSTPYTLQKDILNDSCGTSVKETFYTACDLCNREGSCCEVRSSRESSSRDEKMTKYYEQKLEGLQKLLTQSEECNAALQSETEALRRTCNMLKREERRWYEREMQLKDREQQMTVITNLLDEQKKAADAEIQRLRHQFSHLKSENEILLSHNVQLEESKTKLTKMNKILSQTKVKLLLSENAHKAKDIILEEKEERICQIQLQNEDLHKTISSLEMRVYTTCNFMDLPEESPDTTPIRDSHVNISPIVPSNTISLKAELQACMDENLMSRGNASTQTLVAPVLSSIDTQTDNLSLYCSTYEIQLFVMEDASTQIDSSMRKGIVEMTDCATQTEEISTLSCKIFRLVPSMKSFGCNSRNTVTGIGEVSKDGSFLHFMPDSPSESCDKLQLTKPFVSHGAALQLGDVSCKESASPRVRCESDARVYSTWLEENEDTKAPEETTVYSTKRTALRHERRSRGAQRSEVMAALELQSPQPSRLSYKQDSSKQSSNTLQLADSDPRSSQNEKYISELNNGSSENSFPSQVYSTPTDTSMQLPSNGGSCSRGNIEILEYCSHSSVMSSGLTSYAHEDEFNSQKNENRIRTHFSKCTSQETQRKTKKVIQEHYASQRVKSVLLAICGLKGVSLLFALTIIWWIFFSLMTPPDGCETHTQPFTIHRIREQLSKIRIEYVPQDEPPPV